VTRLSDAGEPSPDGARDHQEAVAFRLERLQLVARSLIGAATPADVIDVIMKLVDTPNAARSRGLWLTDVDDQGLRLAEEHGFAPATASRFRTIALDGDLPGAVACREQRAIVSVSREQSESDYPELRAVERSAECFVAIPMLLEGLCLGVVGLGYEQEPSADDIAFLEAVAGQAAQALARVRLAERDRRRRDEIEFLADLTEAALNAADHEELMHRVTAAAVPMLGDWCSLTFIPTDGGAPHIAVAHVDPAKVQWAEEIQRRHPYDPDASTGVAAVIRSGEPEFIPEITPQLVAAAVEQSSMDPDEVRAIIDALDMTSAIIVPLRTKHRVVGAMQFVTAESKRRYDDDDVALAEAVAGRLAEPLDNAWIFDQQRHVSVTLQRSLLPPRLPEIPGIETAVGYWPAGSSEVGGDFYDLFVLDDCTWAVAIGDACGTGPNSAALTSIARHTIRAAARHGHSHVEVMDWLNEAILKSDRDLFCTASFGTISNRGGRWQLRVASAGHPLPILLSGGTATSIGRPGTLLGVFDSVSVTAATVELKAGDVVVLYTDGLVDLPPPNGITPEELSELVVTLRGERSAEAIAQGIRASYAGRVPEANRDDDVALVVLRVADT
jgi:serine phosphatase RsbU (regulator of sigma subunit)